MMETIKDLFGAVEVTQAELDADRERFYSEKFDPPWLFEKKYGRERETIGKSRETNPIEGRRLRQKDIKFLMSLNKIRQAASGKNHIRQLRAEAMYAMRVGEKISRTEKQTIFSNGVRFNLDGVSERS
jgi:hypothetical protein